MQKFLLTTAVLVGFVATNFSPYTMTEAICGGGQSTQVSDSQEYPPKVPPKQRSNSTSQEKRTERISNSIGPFGSIYNKTKTVTTEPSRPDNNKKALAAVLVVTAAAAVAADGKLTVSDLQYAVPAAMGIRELTKKD